MKKTRFLARLRETIRETAERELRRAGRSYENAPYIDEILGRYARRPATALERSIRRYASQARQATRASEYVQIVGERLGQGVASYLQTGRLPADLPEEFRPARLSGFLQVGASLGQAAAGIGRALFKGKDGAGPRGVDAAALSERLGPGRPLEGSARSRMEAAFGHSFANVRVHADEPAAELNREFRARAFAVGQHVAFGAGEYLPGTPVGDALLAHELAHVVQQSGTRPAPPGALDAAPLHDASAACEAEADEATIGAMVQLYAPSRSPLRRRVRRTRPKLRSALSMARCSVCSGQRPRVANLPSELQITGRPPGYLAAEERRNIYFDRGETQPDGPQLQQKINVLAQPGGELATTNVRIIGIASEDEDPELAGERARNVAEAMRLAGHQGTRQVVADAQRGRGRVDYRNFRMVLIEATGQPTSRPANPTRACGATDEPSFQADLVLAAHQVEVARDALTTPLAAHPLSPHSAAAFRRLFGDPIDDTRVGQMRTNLNNLHTHLTGQMAHEIPIPNPAPSHHGHECATSSHPYVARGWDAGNYGVDADADMTLCPTYFQINSQPVRARMLIHEGSHGTTWQGASGGGTDDVAYEWHRLMPYLTASEGFRNADSLAVFVAAMQPGAPLPELGPAPADRDQYLQEDPGQGPDAGHEDARRAVAFIQRRFYTAHNHTSQLHENMALGSAYGAWPRVQAAFGTATGFSAAGSSPTDEDRFRVAAIVDRLGRGREFLDGNRLRVHRTANATTTWSSGPGVDVYLGQDFFDPAITHERQAQILSAAFLTRISGVPSALVPNYLDLIERIRAWAGDPIVP